MKAKKRHAEKYRGITPNDFKMLHDRHRKVLEIFSRYWFKRVLDIGCGDGSFSILLKNACNAKELYGIEISEKGAQLARKSGVRTFQIDIDLENLPFQDGYLDAIFAGEVIEHLFDPDHLLDEANRVLKAEGMFVLTTPNLAAIHNRIALLLGYQPFPLSVSAKANIGRIFEPKSEQQSLDHIRVFTLHSLKEMLKIHGFETLSVYGSSAVLPENMKFSSFAKALDRFFTLFSGFSYRVILECRKKEK